MVNDSLPAPHPAATGDVGDIIERLLKDVTAHTLTGNGNMMRVKAMRDAASTLESQAAEIEAKNKLVNAINQQREEFHYARVAAEDRAEAAEAENARLSARVSELEERLTQRAEWHKCGCPEPCDDYGVFPGGCTGRYRDDYRDLVAGLNTKEDRTDGRL